jgi:RNA polymerase sigma-70 factor (ECF subfamily)
MDNVTPVNASTPDEPQPEQPPGPAPAARLAVLRRAISRCDAELLHPSARRRQAPTAARQRAGSDAEDATLVAAARDGDERAFQELFSRHARAVRMAIGDRVRDRDRQDDLVQDTFLRAFARLGSLREPERFRPWLLRIARNMGVDEVRRSVRHQFGPVEPDVDSLLGRSHDEPAVAFELRQLAHDVVAGLAALSRRDNRALALSAELGLGIADIASDLGVSNGAAKVILHRARRRLLQAIA